MTEPELHALALRWLECANGVPIYGRDQLALAHWALGLEAELNALRTRLAEMDRLATSLVDVLNAQHDELL